MKDAGIQYNSPQKRSASPNRKKKKMIGGILLELVSPELAAPNDKEWHEDDHNDPADVWDDEEKTDDTKDDDGQDVLKPAGLADHCKELTKFEGITKSAAGKADDCRGQNKAEQDVEDDAENKNADADACNSSLGSGQAGGKDTASAEDQQDDGRDKHVEECDDEYKKTVNKRFADVFNFRVITAVDLQIGTHCDEVDDRDNGQDHQNDPVTNTPNEFIFCITKRSGQIFSNSN
eukprot:TRINITY_DN11596_c0_g1_i1.p1 TRINITY_DN11596_c0_g1~~TRINITY_DN11596_c0_g1_i1.p1  ORF type:complete len:234 (-),score=38.72 TRINITY_DN11596_c0_g1_i1:870-1571(-)